MIRLLLNYLFPPTCHICNSRLASGHRFLCEPCFSQLPATGYNDWESNKMTERFAAVIPFEKCTSSFFYSRGSNISSLIQNFKYRSMPGLGENLAMRATVELLAAGFFADIDAIIGIPMHFLKRAGRGYNQVDFITSGISKTAHLPVLKNLKALHRHGTQTHLNALERQKNLESTFGVDHPEELKGKHILLVDDVCTTGATLIAATETLLKAQPDLRVSLYTLVCTT